MGKSFSKGTTNNLTKTDLLRTLTEGLQQIAVGYDENDEPIYVSDAKSSKHGVNVECTDGSSFSLELKM